MYAAARIHVHRRERMNFRECWRDSPQLDGQCQFAAHGSPQNRCGLPGGDQFVLAIAWSAGQRWVIIGVTRWLVGWQRMLVIMITAFRVTLIRCNYANRVIIST